MWLKKRKHSVVSLLLVWLQKGLQKPGVFPVVQQDLPSD